EIDARDLDHPLGTYHLVGEVVGADLGVVAGDGERLELGEDRAALVVAEAAADAREDVVGAVGAHERREEVVEHAAAVGESLAVADDDDAEREAVLPLEEAGGVAADDEALGLAARDPGLELGLHVLDLAGEEALDGVRELAAGEDLRQPLPRLGVACGAGL